jgi:hypothetical protein
MFMSKWALLGIDSIKYHWKVPVWKLKWIDIGWYVFFYSFNAIAQINTQRDGCFSIPKCK